MSCTDTLHILMNFHQQIWNTQQAKAQELIAIPLCAPSKESVSLLAQAPTFHFSQVLARVVFALLAEWPNPAARR
jgi:hypothetical protein